MVGIHDDDLDDIIKDVGANADALFTKDVVARITTTPANFIVFLFSLYYIR